MAARKRDTRGHFVSKQPSAPKRTEQAKPEPVTEQKPNTGLVMGNKGGQGSK